MDSGVRSGLGLMVGKSTQVFTPKEPRLQQDGINVKMILCQSCFCFKGGPLSGLVTVPRRPLKEEGIVGALFF